jgi:hypothetical protein
MKPTDKAIFWDGERVSGPHLEILIGTQVAKFVPMELLQSTGASRRWFSTTQTQYGPSKLPKDILRPLNPLW